LALLRARWLIDLLHERRIVDRHLADGRRTRFLANDLDLGRNVERVVRSDLTTEAVLQGGDDAAAVGVVLRIGGGNEQHVEGQPDLVAAYLLVALLEHVEESDLDALGEVGEFVDREDAPVRARHQPVVEGEFVAEVTTLRHLDRIHLADEVGDRGVRRGELLAVAIVAVYPLDRGLVTAVTYQVAGMTRDRVERIIVDLAPGDDRHPLVEQPGERADDPCLALTAFAEEHHVVTGEHRVLHLRQHGVVVSHDPGHERRAGTDRPHRVFPDLVLHRARLPSGGLQLSERGDRGFHRPTP
jgi:hypothetical protein